MEQKILTVQDYEEVERYLAEINDKIIEFNQDVNNAIQKFDNGSAVQQFYNSGNYGQDIKARILEIKNAVNEYFNVVANSENSLVKQTRKYTAEQIDLLLSSSRGYTRSESWAGRREGNLNSHVAIANDVGKVAGNIGLGAAAAAIDAAKNTLNGNSKF